MGLNCKHFYDLVPVICKREIKNICIKHFSDDGDAPSMLEPYEMNEAEQQIQTLAFEAIDVVIDMLHGTELAYPEKVVFRGEYIGLMRQLYYSDLLLEEPQNVCSKTGHSKIGLSKTGWCAICPIVSKIRDHMAAEDCKVVEWCGMNCKHAGRMRFLGPERAQ